VVYVVGVDPDRQGGGLGKALTLAGLRHLQAQGVLEVMLYVEADNAAAVRVYTKLGFTLWDADVQYAR
jgi:mycothiol synthase